MDNRHIDGSQSYQQLLLPPNPRLKSMTLPKRSIVQEGLCTGDSRELNSQTKACSFRAHSRVPLSGEFQVLCHDGLALGVG